MLRGQCRRWRSQWPSWPNVITPAKTRPTTSIASITFLPSSAAVAARTRGAIAADFNRLDYGERPARVPPRSRRQTRLRAHPGPRRGSTPSPPRPRRRPGGRRPAAGRSARSARLDRQRPQPSRPPRRERARARRGSRRAGARCRRRPARTGAVSRNGVGSPRRSSPGRARSAPRRAARRRAPPHVRRPGAARLPRGRSRLPPRERSSPRRSRLQPGCELLRPVRDDEVGARADDRGQRLQCCGALVDPAARRGGL